MEELHLVYGLVTEWKPGYARVKLPTFDDIVTDWLPINKTRAMNDDINWPLEVDEQVNCLVDAYCGTGIILGASSNNVDTPDPEAAKGKLRIKFSDGSFIEYDKTAHKLHTKVGTTELTMAGSETKVEMGAAKLTMTSAGFKIEAGGNDLGSVLQDVISHVKDALLDTPSGPGAINAVTKALLVTDASKLATILT